MPLFFDVLSLETLKQQPSSPEDLFSDSLAEMEPLDPYEQLNKVCLVSGTTCLLLDTDSEGLPEVNQQADTEIARSLKPSCKPKLIQTASFFSRQSEVTGALPLSQTDPYCVFTCDSLGGLYLSSDGFKRQDSNSVNCLIPRDDGTLGTFMNRYKTARRMADETNLIVSTNFVKRYTFDEVDVTNVVSELLKNDSSGELQNKEIISQDDAEDASHSGGVFEAAADAL